MLICACHATDSLKKKRTFFCCSYNVPTQQYGPVIQCNSIGRAFQHTRRSLVVLDEMDTSVKSNFSINAPRALLRLLFYQCTVLVSFLHPFVWCVYWLFKSGNGTKDILQQIKSQNHCFSEIETKIQRSCLRMLNGFSLHSLRYSSISFFSSI